MIKNFSTDSRLLPDMMLHNLPLENYPPYKRMLRSIYLQIGITWLLLSQYISMNQSTTPFLVICSAASPIFELKGDIDHQQQSSPSLSQIPKGHNTQINDKQRIFRDQQQDELHQMSSNAWLPYSQNQTNLKSPRKLYSSNGGPLSDFNSTSLNNPNPEYLQEGSGDSPVSVSQHHKEKFDDTEEGEDDDDDDYDYKDSLDSGSGNGNELLTSKKAESVMIQGNNQIKKPTMNGDDIYLPFRSPTTVGNASATMSPTTPAPPTRYVMFNKTNPEIGDALKTPFNIKQELNQSFGHNRPSSPQVDNRMSDDDMKSATKLPPILPPFEQTHPNLPLSVQQITEKPKQILPTTSTIDSSNNQLKISKVPLSTSSPVSTKFKVQNSNGSSLLRPNNSMSTDIDYDYEEENEDEDSEDVTNFEDNETSENEMVNKTTAQINTTITPIVASKPQISPKPILTGTVIPVTAFSKPPIISSQPNRHSFNSSNGNLAHSITKYPTTFIENHFVSVGPTVISSTSASNTLGENDRNAEEDEEEDEEEDDEEEEEEIEDTIDEDGTDNEATSNLGSFSGRVQSGPPSPSSNWITQSPPVPTYHDLNDGHNKLSKSTGQKITTSIFQPNDYPPTNRPLAPIASNAPIKASTTTISSPTTTTTSTTPKTITITTATTSTTTTPSATTITTTSTTSTIATTLPTVAPMVSYTSTTMRTTPIRYATTPKNRVTPTITRTSNIMTYDRSLLQDDDADLTRQIYDKVIEIYQATSKAIHTAIEAVWPPTFELNSSTFEPLLAQPLLFMLTLGAAVIGLVLTMMLVVHIITYQIQPKDDISIY